jgi:LysR family transcriptional regulator, transcriptional activator of nhaA
MNFKHLYYFWMTARTGGIIRAGQRLHVTPQTLSGQIKLLEERLGCRLFERQGRNIQLTDAGRIAVGYAEQIFLLGSQLEGALKGRAGTGGVAPLKVGIADSVPKSIAFHLRQPAVVDAPPTSSTRSRSKETSVIHQSTASPTRRAVSSSKMPGDLCID